MDKEPACFKREGLQYVICHNLGQTRRILESEEPFDVIRVIAVRQFYHGKKLPRLFGAGAIFVSMLYRRRKMLTSPTGRAQSTRNSSRKPLATVPTERSRKKQTNIPSTAARIVSSRLMRVAM